MYPSAGRILIAQSCVASEGKCATALITLRAAASWESSLLDIYEPSGVALGVSWKIASLLSIRGSTL